MGFFIVTFFILVVSGQIFASYLFLWRAIGGKPVTGKAYQLTEIWMVARFFQVVTPSNPEQCSGNSRLPGNDYW